MTATTPYFADCIDFCKEDFETLTDILLDRFTLPGYFNPVVEFLAQKTGYPVTAVSDSFRYMQHFGEFSRMPFAKALTNSTPGPAFWWDLYSMYDEVLQDNGCKKMLHFITNVL